MTKLILCFVLGFSVQKRDCDFCHTEHWHSKGACLFCFCLLIQLLCCILFVCVLRLSHITVMVEWTLKVNYLFLHLSFCLWRTTMVLKGCVCWYCLGFCCRYFVIFCLFVCCCFPFYLSSFLSFSPSLFLFLFVCLFVSFFLSIFLSFFLSSFLSFYPSLFLFLFVCLFVCFLLSFFLSCSHFLSFFPSFSLKLFMSFSTCTRELLLCLITAARVC